MSNSRAKRAGARVGAARAMPIWRGLHCQAGPHRRNSCAPRHRRSRLAPALSEDRRPRACGRRGAAQASNATGSDGCDSGRVGLRIATNSGVSVRRDRECRVNASASVHGAGRRRRRARLRSMGNTRRPGIACFRPPHSWRTSTVGPVAASEALLLLRRQCERLAGRRTAPALRPLVLLGHRGSSVALGIPALGRLALERPELARVAAAVGARWRRYGLSTAIEAVPRRLGPARIALSTGSVPLRVTLYLYDSAGEATRLRRALRRDHVARETRTAGFCLYVGARDLAPSRFALLFDIAEAHIHPA